MLRVSEAEARLTVMLERAALDPEHLDAWEAWKTFKAFVREPAQADDEGITVQAVRETTPDGIELVYVSFLRQFMQVEGDQEELVRYVGIELAYDGGDVHLTEDVEVWSYDFPRFEDFAAHVEQLPVFVRAAASQVVESTVIGGEL